MASKESKPKPTVSFTTVNKELQERQHTEWHKSVINKVDDGKIVASKLEDGTLIYIHSFKSQIWHVCHGCLKAFKNLGSAGHHITKCPYWVKKAADESEVALTFALEEPEMLEFKNNGNESDPSPPSPKGKTKRKAKSTRMDWGTNNKAKSTHIDWGSDAEESNKGDPPPQGNKKRKASTKSTKTNNGTQSDSIRVPRKSRRTKK